MTRNRDDLSGSFETEDSGGWLTRFLADEDEFDRRAMWRLGSWAVGSVGAVVLAILATQSSTQTKREQVAAADLARQSQMIQRVAKEAQVETDRLASAIDTLNRDRDRLFSRLGSLEQGLDSVTGSIAQQKSQPQAAPPQADKAAAVSAPQAGSQPESAAKIETPVPPIAPVESKPVATPFAEPKPVAAPPAESRPVAATPVDPKSDAKAQAASAVSPEATKLKPVPLHPLPATPALPAPLMPPQSIMAPPDQAASKLLEPVPPAARAAVTATDPETEIDDNEPDPPAVPVQRTEFGIDLGGANSIEGLRALWQRLLKSNKVLAALRPIIVVKEKPAGGTHLRLVAGPLTDAATAAKFCAILSGGDRFCETSVFDGQRLATGVPVAPSKPARKRNIPQRATSAVEPAPEPPKPASLTSFLGIR